MVKQCVTPKFKKSHNAKPLGNRVYNVTLKTGRRKVKILCNGKWQFRKK